MVEDKQESREELKRMGVRKITNAGRTVNIGKFPSIKMGRNIWYESLLERDLMFIVEYDSDVIFYREQPLRIFYHLGGKMRRYVPDLLVTRADERQIIEVKYKEKASRPEYEAMFHAVSPICRREGYKFKVYTEEQIREQPRLNNIKFMWRYARTPISPHYQLYCHDFLAGKPRARLEELYEYLQSKRISRQALFALLYWGVISTDLTIPISLDSQIHLPVKATSVKEAA